MTVIWPVSHPLAEFSITVGLEYNGIRGKEKESDTKQDSDAEDLPQVKQEEEGPPAPHIFVATTAVPSMTINLKGLSSWGASVLKDLVEEWYKTVEPKNDDELTDVIRVWKCKKPQQQSELKAIEGSYAKLTHAISENLSGLLQVVLEESGAVYTTDKAAPWGWLEREAGKMMKCLGNQ